MGLIATLILGLIAGWLTGMLMKGSGGYGIIGDIVLGIIGAVVCGWAAHTAMKMVESHPERWSQGRCFLSAVSLCVSLTWMPNGTLSCDNRLWARSTYVRFCL